MGKMEFIAVEKTETSFILCSSPDFSESDENGTGCRVCFRNCVPFPLFILTRNAKKINHGVLGQRRNSPRPFRLNPAYCRGRKKEKPKKEFFLSRAFHLGENGV